MKRSKFTDPVRQAHGQRVILASRRVRQHRRVQVAVVASYTKSRSSRCDRRGRDQEAKRGQVPCRARRHPDLRLGFARLHGEIDASLSSQRELLVFDRLNEARPLSRSLSVTKRAPCDAACYWCATLRLRLRLAAAQPRRRSRPFAD
jgi:hypothetical protein